MRAASLVLAFACALIAGDALAASKLYVTEYSKLGVTQTGVQPPIAAEPGTDRTPVDFSGGAASIVLGAGAFMARLMCDSRCSIRISTAGTAATTSNKPLAADAPEYFGVTAGDTVSVIANP